MAAFDILDRVHSLAAFEVLARDADQFAERFALELPDAGEIEARDAMFGAALVRIDETIARAMRLRLDDVLAHDTALAPQTRRLFATTIVGYAGKLEVLQQRVHDVAVRARAADPAALAHAVGDAAGQVLGLRERLREGVLALVRDGAAAMVPVLDRAARDRTRDETDRRRSSASRRECEALVAAPARVATAAWSARVAGWPEQLDEPAAEADVTFADMIELD